MAGNARRGIVLGYDPSGIMVSYDPSSIMVNYDPSGIIVTYDPSGLTPDAILGLGDFDEGDWLGWCRGQSLPRGETWGWLKAGTKGANLCHWIYWAANDYLSASDGQNAVKIIGSGLINMVKSNTLTAADAAYLWKLSKMTGEWGDPSAHYTGTGLGPPGGVGPGGPDFVSADAGGGDGGGGGALPSGAGGSANPVNSLAASLGVPTNYVYWGGGAFLLLFLMLMLRRH